MGKLKRCVITIRNMIGITLFVIALGSFSKPEPQDSLLVDQDGNRYPVRKMPDNNLWMTTNLKLNIPDSYCYENIKENCEQYGRLYTWESAQNGCPLLGQGWRLPTNDEWRELVKHYGGVPDDASESRKKAFAALLDGTEFNGVLGGGRRA